MEIGIFRQMRTICLLLLASLLAMGAVAPLGAFAKSKPHASLHVSFGQTIVPNAGAFKNLDSGIAKGPDGAFWFTESGANKIGRISSNGSIREYSLPTPGSEPEGITNGPDHALWFTEAAGDKIGRITTYGVIEEFDVSTLFTHPFDIVTGPDHALWFTDRGANLIGRITTAGTFASFPYFSAGTGAVGIITGPDHALWFGENGGGVGRITTGGIPSSYPISSLSRVVGLASGPDGNIWFTEPDSNKIGRLNPRSGFVTEFPVPTPGSSPLFIVNLGDGTLAFTEFLGGQIGRIDKTGNVSEFAIPWGNSHPTAITKDSSKGSARFIEAAPGANVVAKIAFSVH